MAYKKIGVTTLAVLLIAGCAGPEAPTAALPEAMAPAHSPTQIADYAIKDHSDGEIRRTTLTPTKGGYAGENSAGCTWKVVEHFSPSTEWQNCDGSTGTQLISSEEGALWPLEVGNRKSWSFSGQDASGNNWDGTRTCTVESTELVKIAVGDIPSYKISCQDPWSQRTFWYAPSVGHVVYYQRYHKTRNEHTGWEYAGEQQAAS
ncbi:MAG: hypothetical protein AAF367_15455 [Pseudomonadota bacterium]